MDETLRCILSLPIEPTANSLWVGADHNYNRKTHRQLSNQCSVTSNGGTDILIKSPEGHTTTIGLHSSSLGNTAPTMLHRFRPHASSSVIQTCRVIPSKLSSSQMRCLSWRPLQKSFLVSWRNSRNLPKIDKYIDLQWVPAHSRVPGNHSRSPRQYLKPEISNLHCSKWHTIVLLHIYEYS